MIKIKLKAEKPENIESPKNPETEVEKPLTYNQLYYLRNKEKLKKSKKNKYLSSKEYRDKIKTRALERWFKKKQERVTESIQDIDSIPFDKKSMRYVYKDDNKIRFFSITAFAKIIGVTRETINNWHKLNVLPVPMYTEGNEKIKKWYAEIYIKNVITVLLSRRTSNIEDLRSEIKKQFEVNPDIEFSGKSAVTEEEKKSIEEMFTSTNES